MNNSVLSSMEINGNLRCRFQRYLKNDICQEHENFQKFSNRYMLKVAKFGVRSVYCF